jgi:uncharacterized protein YqhQ
MMRAAGGFAIAVRRADGSITTKTDQHVPLAKRYRLLNLPVVRGAVSLVEMMIIGFKALEFSANEAAKDVEPAPGKKGEAKVEDVPGAKKDQEISRLALAGTFALSIGLGLLLFVVIPNLATHFAGKLGPGTGTALLEERAPVLYNLVSGAIRMLIVVGYIWAISLMKDIKRLFQYHGAEHKTVSAFEAGKELTVDNVRPFTRLHPRCGTTFIAIVLLVAIVVFAFFAKLLVFIWPQFYDMSFAFRKTVLIAGHILIMPIVAGVCFELLRLGGKYRNNLLLKLLITPGYWFQGLTTREPDDSMLETAITSLKAALALPVAVPVVAAETQRIEPLEPAAALDA